MKIIFFTCFVVLFMQYILSVSGSCRCKKDTPLKFIFQIVTHFKEVHSCGRTFITNFGVSKDGVRQISYQAELKENESPIDLCKCVHDYLSQKDWLDGSIQSCCVRKNIATMTIEGEPDPTFDPETDNSSPKSLPAQLKAIFDQFKYAEFKNHNCQPTAKKDKAGNVCFKIQCDLRPDSPSKEELCEGLSHYLNQDNWLGELNYACKSDGKVLDMEFVN